jgi:hypothetical protein
MAMVALSKIKATIAIIQITRLLVKLECLEIILFNAFAFFIHKSKIRATSAIMGEAVFWLKPLYQLGFVCFFDFYFWIRVND